MTYRSRKSIATAIIGAIFLIGIAIEGVIANGFSDSITLILIIAALCTGLYLVIYRPHLEIFDEGVRIHNPLSIVQVGWHEVDSIDARYSAVLTMKDGRRFTIWCAQAPGRYHARTIHPSEVKGLNLSTVIRPGESPRTDSGVAIALCRQRQEAFHLDSNSTGFEFRIERDYLWLKVLAIVSIAIVFSTLH